MKTVIIRAHFCFAKTGLSAAIFWLRQKDFRSYPLRPTGFQRFCTEENVAPICINGC
jgi:hypothetical protein